MASKGQLTGMTGVYYVAAELSKLGFIVTPTSRNAQGIDLLIANSNGTKSFSAQVKTNATTFSFWLLGEKNQKMKSDSFFYIFVNLRKSEIEYFIIPSKIVAKKIYHQPTKNKATGKISNWYSFPYREALKFKRKWLDSFGNPNPRISKKKD